MTCNKSSNAPPARTFLRRVKGRMWRDFERLVCRVMGSVGGVELLLALGVIDRNGYYDRLTEVVMARSIRDDSVCVDIGCHMGHMLKQMLRLAPNGQHLAFEPLPNFFERLERQFKSERVRLFRIALSREEGTVTFKHVVNHPGYSGLLRRQYAVENEVVEEITVQTRRFDALVGELGLKSVDFVKIDVEGAERWVMEGAKETLARFKPTMVFECGLGAAEFYETKPEQVFDLLAGCGLRISRLATWLRGRPELSREEFCRRYNERRDYFWIAHR